MKKIELTEKEIRQMIRGAIQEQLKVKALKEEFQTDGESTKELFSFLDKCDKTLEKCRTDLLAVIEEGQTLATKDLSKKMQSAGAVQVVGILKKIHSIVAQSVEALKKSVG